jgi:hypothetical protein
MKRLGWLALAFLCLAACTRHAPSPEVLRLKGNIEMLEHENAAYDAKLRDARNDPGLHEWLLADRELLKSRLDRLRAQLKELQPDAVAKGEGEEK